MFREKPVQATVRTFRSLHAEISFQDFAELFHKNNAQGSHLWRSMQTRRWRALIGLIEAFRIRDPETWDHSLRVHDQAVALAEAIKLSSDEVRIVKITSLLHDIGKMAVNEAVLNKEEKLSEDEILSIRLHPEMGERLVQPLLPHAQVLAGIRHHHERLDGLGYPDRLPGEAVPLAARIISISDVFDALTHVRPYRKKHLSRIDAVHVLETQTEGQLDADLVKSFASMIRSTEETAIDYPSLR